MKDLNQDDIENILSIYNTQLKPEEKLYYYEQIFKNIDPKSTCKDDKYRGVNTALLAAYVGSIYWTLRFLNGGAKINARMLPPNQIIPQDYDICQAILEGKLSTNELGKRIANSKKDYNGYGLLRFAIRDQAWELAFYLMLIGKTIMPNHYDCDSEIHPLIQSAIENNDKSYYLYFLDNFLCKKNKIDPSKPGDLSNRKKINLNANLINALVRIKASTTLDSADKHLWYEVIFRSLNPLSIMPLPKNTKAQLPYTGVNTLLVAAYVGCRPWVEKLLQAGARTDCQNQSAGDPIPPGMNLITALLQAKQSQLAKRILKKELCNLNAVVQAGPHQGFNTLLWAAKHQHWQIVDTLIHLNVDLNIRIDNAQNRDDHGKTLIAYLFSHKKFDLLYKALRNGAQIHLLQKVDNKIYQIAYDFLLNTNKENAPWPFFYYLCALEYIQLGTVPERVEHPFYRSVASAYKWRVGVQRYLFNSVVCEGIKIFAPNYNRVAFTLEESPSCETAAPQNTEKKNNNKNSKQLSYEQKTKLLTQNSMRAGFFKISPQIKHKIATFWVKKKLDLIRFPKDPKFLWREMITPHIVKLITANHSRPLTNHEILQTVYQQSLQDSVVTPDSELAQFAHLCTQKQELVLFLEITRRLMHFGPNQDVNKRLAMEIDKPHTLAWLCEHYYIPILDDLKKMPGFKTCRKTREALYASAEAVSLKRSDPNNLTYKDYVQVFKAVVPNFDPILDIDKTCTYPASLSTLLSPDSKPMNQHPGQTLPKFKQKNSPRALAWMLFCKITCSLVYHSSNYDLFWKTKFRKHQNLMLSMLWQNDFLPLITAYIRMGHPKLEAANINNTCKALTQKAQKTIAVSSTGPNRDDYRILLLSVFGKPKTWQKKPVAAEKPKLAQNNGL